LSADEAEIIKSPLVAVAEKCVEGDWIRKERQRSWGFLPAYLLATFLDFVWLQSLRLLFIPFPMWGWQVVRAERPLPSKSDRIEDEGNQNEPFLD